MKKIWWKVRYCYWLWRRTLWTFKAMWMYAGEALESAGNDTSECPKEWVDEEISCMGD